MKKVVVLLIISLSSLLVNAKTPVDSLLLIINQSTDTIQKLNAYKQLLESDLYYKDYKFFLTSYKYLTKQNTYHRANYHLFLSKYYYYQTKYDSAIIQAEKGMKIYRMLPDKNNDYIKAIIQKGRCFDILLRYDSAKVYYEKAIAISKTKLDSLLSLFQYAKYYISISQFDNATKYLDISYGLSKETKNDFFKGQILYRIAYLQTTSKKYIEADKLLNKSISILKKYKDKKHSLGKAYLLKGNNYFFKGDKNMALIYYLKALKINKNINDISAIAYCYSSIGASYTYLNKFNYAHKYLDSAIDIQENNKLINYLTTSYSRKTVLFFKEKNIEKAIESINKALLLSKKTKNYEKTYSSFYNIAYLLNVKKKYKQAYLFLDSAFKYKDSIYNKNYFDKITLLQTKYETQQKENQILQLTSDNNLKKAELKQAQLTNVILFSVFGLIIITGLFFWQRFKQQQRIEILKSKVHADEQVRNEIGRELHDGIAGKLIRMVHLIENDNPDTADQLLQTYDEVRALSHQLNNTSMRDIPFIDRIVDIIPSDIPGKSFELIIKPENLVIKEPYGTHIYRIIQELIANNLKHSNANLTRIQIRQTGDKLSLIYHDNGTDIQAIKKGSGLQNIYDRTALMKGTIKITTDDGFRVEIEGKL